MEGSDMSVRGASLPIGRQAADPLSDTAGRQDAQGRSIRGKGPGHSEPNQTMVVSVPEKEKVAANHHSQTKAPESVPMASFSVADLFNLCSSEGGRGEIQGGGVQT